MRSFSNAYSMMDSSLSRTVTGLPIMPQMQAFSHRAGQTRPVNSGKQFVLSRRLSARSRLPVQTRSFHSGMRLCSGQPSRWPPKVIPA
jgi:hypothetical protein